MDLWQLMKLPRAELGQGSAVQLRIGGDAETLGRLLAEEMAQVIRASNAAGRSACLIVPVGPVDQYAHLAATIVREGLDCGRLTLVNMDEFLGPDGEWIDPEHPLSFRGFMEREFHGRIPPRLAVRPENRVFPDPRDPAALAGLIADRGGVDVCFGGIGLNGHLAFNEPEDVSPAEFAARPARVLDIAPESRAHMAVNLSCAIDLIPRRAVTVGMREILAARRVSVYANRPWQCGVVRLALHGPVSAHCPVSFLQTHPDAHLTIADFVAEPREVRLR
jgi:glucosamine-6-phosphate deaminase